MFTEGHVAAIAVTEALRARATTQVRVISFDANDAIIGELRDRFIDGLVVQDAFEMGYETIRAIVSGIRGEPVPGRVETSTHVVDRANLETPEIVQLLYPDTQRYLGARPR
jgi:ribose transport system substrate-binding protein